MDVDDLLRKRLDELAEEGRRVAEESRRAQEKLNRLLDWTVENLMARKRAKEERRAADELERQAIQSPPDSRPESQPAKTKRTRIDRLRVAVDAAEEVLQGKLRRRPTADEFFDYLADRDETGIIVDSTSEKLVWQDSRGKEHDIDRPTFANRLSRYHN